MGRYAGSNTAAGRGGRRIGYCGRIIHTDEGHSGCMFPFNNSISAVIRAHLQRYISGWSNISETPLNAKRTLLMRGCEPYAKKHIFLTQQIHSIHRATNIISMGKFTTLGLILLRSSHTLKPPCFARFTHATQVSNPKCEQWT